MKSQAFPPGQPSYSPSSPPARSRVFLPAIPHGSVNVIAPLNTRSPVRRKPLPQGALSPPFSASPSSDHDQIRTSLEQRIEPLSATTSDQDSDLVVRDLDRFPHGNTPVLTSTHAGLEGLHGIKRNSENADTIPEPATADTDSSAATLVIDPVVDVGTRTLEKQGEMGFKPGTRPPPLRMDSSSSTNSLSVNDAKEPQSPGGKVSSFFGWKRTASSPSTDSTTTEDSDSGRSPGPSAFAPSPQTSAYSTHAMRPHPPSAKPFLTLDHEAASIGGPLNSSAERDDDHVSKASQLEAELREITMELAGSIKREMELEDLVEKLQLEAHSNPGVTDRTSDYFSDSATSSMRPPGSDAGHRDDLEKVKRGMEQHRAQMRVSLSQRWQDERLRRKALESHVRILEDQISSSRRDVTELSDLASRARELERALEDVKRRLQEERKAKENFEDLLTGLRVELEQHRNERDNLRDEVIPQLRSQVEGLEGNLSDSHKQDYDLARIEQEMKKLKDENVTLTQRIGSKFEAIAEEEFSTSPTQMHFGLARSNSTAQLSLSNPSRGLTRNGSVSRSNTLNTTLEPLSDALKAVEQQRDALHSTVRYLLRRQEYQSRGFEKKMRILERERERAKAFSAPHKGGYEKEVKGLRTEINSLRKRADDALDQKWQCEKGLGGLKMDLDRSKQETGGLRRLLSERSDNVAGSALSSLEGAYNHLRRERQQLASRRGRESSSAIVEEQQLADQVAAQLQANSSLRNRLKDAVERGELNQQTSADQISGLQVKLRKLEDAITSAQTQSETAVMKHEEEIRVLRASHNAQLMRAKTVIKTPGLLSPTPRSPLSPLFSNSKRSPRLDRTTTGPGVALHQALKTEYLEHKVSELERALADAEKEMGEVVGRMNTAQINVAELQSERDEALRQSRKLEAAIMAERQKIRAH